MGKVTRPQKIALLVIGTLLMVPVIIGILSVQEDKVCIKRIEDDGIVSLCKMSQCYSRLNDGSIHSTIEYLYENKKYYTESPMLVRKFPVNLPVYVKYSASDPNCVIVLMDSVVVFGSQKVRYHKIKLKGWDYQIEDLSK